MLKIRLFKTRPNQRPGICSSLAVLATGALLACSEGVAHDAAWTVRADTLPDGRVHLVHSAPPGGDAPTWVIEEELRIGSIDGEGPSAFGDVRGIAVTAAGQIAVLEAQAQELRIFNSDGSHAVTFGGEGGGPGEFQSAHGLMISPDGLLYVPDSRAGRMSVFDPTNGFVRSHPFRVLRRGFIWGGRMDAQGRILKPSITLEEPRRSVMRVYDGEMREVEILDLPPEPEIDREDPPMSFAFETNGGGGFVSVPWYPRAVNMMDPEGGFWGRGLSDPSYKITRWFLPGDTTLVIEATRPPVLVSSVERDSAINSVRETIEGIGGKPPGDWSKIPEVKPAVTQMFLSDELNLWVERASADGRHRYDVYDREGARVGSAVTSLRIWQHLPPRVRGDQFYALVTDHLDVPYVVRARLVAAEQAEQTEPRQ